jgi:hypothetical protein
MSEQWAFFATGSVLLEKSLYGYLIYLRCLIEWRELQCRLLVLVGNIVADYRMLLQVPIFEKGYEKDPAVVAKEAIREAVRTNQDVVLVDTAGRMQVRCRFYC